MILQMWADAAITGGAAFLGAVIVGLGSYKAAAMQAKEATERGRGELLLQNKIERTNELYANLSEFARDAREFGIMLEREDPNQDDQWDRLQELEAACNDSLYSIAMYYKPEIWGKLIGNFVEMRDEIKLMLRKSAAKPQKEELDLQEHKEEIASRYHHTLKILQKEVGDPIDRL